MRCLVHGLLSAACVAMFSACGSFTAAANETNIVNGHIWVCTDDGLCMDMGPVPASETRPPAAETPAPAPAEPEIPVAPPNHGVPGFMIREPSPEEPSAEQLQAEELQAEEPPAEEPPAEEAPLPRRRRWPWIALAVGIPVEIVIYLTAIALISCGLFLAERRLLRKSR